MATKTKLEMRKEVLFPPRAPKSWSGIPRAIRRNYTSNQRVGGGDGTRYSVDFKGIEERYAKTLALGRDCFRDQSIAVLIGTKTTVPGLNAILTAIVRTGHFIGAKVYFIKNGLFGLMSGRRFFEEVTWNKVTGTASLTTCILETQSCPDAFDDVKSKRKAVKNLMDHLALNLIVIGGERTLQQGIAIRQEWDDHIYELIEDGTIRTQKAKDAAKKFQMVGILASMENDYIGGNHSLGMDSALRQIANISDGIDNSSARGQRVGVVYVRGDECGALAIRAALALEADYLLTPETPPFEGWEAKMGKRIMEAKSDGGTFNNVVVLAEGTKRNTGEPITPSQVKDAILENTENVEVRIHDLGHAWIGAPPSFFDKFMGFRFGTEAVLSCLDQFHGLPPSKESVDSAKSGKDSNPSVDSADDPAVPVVLCIERNSLTRISLESFLNISSIYPERLKNKLARGASNQKYRSEMFQIWRSYYEDVIEMEPREFHEADILKPTEPPPILIQGEEGDEEANIQTNLNKFTMPPPRKSDDSEDETKPPRRPLSRGSERKTAFSAPKRKKLGGVVLPDHRMSLGIVFVGAPCGGMNSCIFAFSRFARRIGCRPVGFVGGTKGMCDIANVRDLSSWFCVQGYLGRGGCALGTGDDPDFLPDGESLYRVAANLARQKIQALIIVGGFKAYQTGLKFQRSREAVPEFRIPIKIIPASTFGNVAGSDFSLGVDTILNQLMDDVESLRHSSVGATPILHLVTPTVPNGAEEGANWGLLTTMAAMTANAEGSYVLEEEFDYTEIKVDALQYKVKMYDGMSHGVFFINSSWGGAVTMSLADTASATDSRASGRSERSGPGSAAGGQGDGAGDNDEKEEEEEEKTSKAGSKAYKGSKIPDDINDESLDEIAKGGMEGIVAMFREYAKDPENCKKSEYTVQHTYIGSVCGAGRPSVMDRQIGVLWTLDAMKRMLIEAKFQRLEEGRIEGVNEADVSLFPMEMNEIVEVVGVFGAHRVFTPVQDLIRTYDFRLHIPKHLWWLALRPLTRILSAHHMTYDYLVIDIFRKKKEEDYRSDPDWVPELEEKIRQLERGDEDDEVKPEAVKSTQSVTSESSATRRRMKIVICRNTMTQLRENRVFQGWLDIHLNEDGEREARYLGSTLKNAGFSFDVVFTSGLTRHLKTAYYIQSKMGLEKIPNHKSWRLNSRMMGQLEGMSRTEAVEKFGYAKVQDWCNSPFSVPPAVSLDSALWPGHDVRYSDVEASDIPVAESQVDTMERFLPFWNRIIKPTLEMNKDVLIVAGKNIQRAVLKIIYKISDGDLDEWELDFDALTPLAIELNYKWKPLSYAFIEGEGIQNYIDSELNAEKLSSVVQEGEGKEGGEKKEAVPEEGGEEEEEED